MSGRHLEAAAKLITDVLLSRFRPAPPIAVVETSPERDRIKGINNIVSNALLMGFSKDFSIIGPDIILDVVEDLDLEPV